ncbi:MAG: hypothetical protein H5U36_08845 [Candidatus Caldatribacterium sp.]|nr:hypothetical protein [Candidatus Caldatribacterium sp.]
MREPVFTEVEGRKIFAGWIDGEVFEKEITKRSIFRNSKAWGTEKEVIEKLKSRGVRVIRLIRKDTGEVLEIPLFKFLERAFPLRLPGKPEQLLVQLKHFAVTPRV